ncbi:MAG: TRAP transporter fused permease subunit [Burkholderiaceae bacterium]
MTTERPLARLAHSIAWLLGLGIALQSVYSAYFGVSDPTIHRPVIAWICLVVVIAHRFHVRAQRTQHISWPALAIDLALLALISLGIWRFLVNADNVENMLVDFSREDQLIAFAAVVALIEVSRREFGWGLAAFAGITLAYCLWGQFLPGWLGHAGFSLDQAMQGIWFGFQGVFGMPVAILLEVLFIYIVFGVILEATGAGQSMIRMSLWVVGRIPGGAAHAAIVSSSLFGAVSGSVVANVVGTGTFTIPMIKRQGFKPAFAGAVEAAASSGGQIMPPVMGAAAFLMAQLTGISYLTICVAALVPALIYYGSLFLAVYVEAKRLGIRGLEKHEIPRPTAQDWLHALMFIGPILTIIAVMVAGRSPAMAGFWATVIGVALGFLNADVRRKPWVLIDALARGGLNCARILVAVGAIGIVIAGLNLTGLGLSFAQAVLAVTDQSLLLGLILTALACIALGTGLPTLPSYLIIVLVMGPAIVKLGVPLLAIHMFVFYYGIISHLTPPVALAAMAAAPIADANPVAVAITGTRLALVKFVLPFLFVFSPSLLIVVDFAWGEFLWAMLRILVITYAVTTALARFDRRNMSRPEAAVRLLGAALALLEYPSLALAGIVISVLTILIHHLGRQGASPSAATSLNEKETPQ